MSHSTLLSVILPVYKTERQLARCLSSLLEQDLAPDDYEVIVVDDGSPDDSVVVASGFEKRYPNVVIVRQANRGVGAARNAGLDIARGRYLWFVDSDDYVASAVMAGLARLMERGQLDVLAFGCKHVDDESRPLRDAPRFDWDATLDVVTGIQLIASGPYTREAWVYLFDRAFVERNALHFVEQRHLEDVLFTAVALTAAKRVARVSADVYRYVHRPGSTTRRRAEESTQVRKKMVDDYEHALFALQDLRVRASNSGVTEPGYHGRLRLVQESILFFLVVRLVRTGLPLRPLLSDVLRRARSLGVYPLTRFPGRDYPSWYRPLTMVVNHTFLLWPIAVSARLVISLRTWFGGRGRVLG
jgi:glycosyltransferase involved in cell wall biosynthesis